MLLVILLKRLPIWLLLLDLCYATWAFVKSVGLVIDIGDGNNEHIPLFSFKLDYCGFDSCWIWFENNDDAGSFG